MVSTATVQTSPQISGYTLTEKIYEGFRTSVYRAVVNDNSTNTQHEENKRSDSALNNTESKTDNDTEDNSETDSTLISSTSTESAQTVIIKILRTEYPSLSELVQFRNQYTLTKDLSIPGIIKPIALIDWQNGYALVMEDFRGISLQQYYNTHRLSLPECLAIAHKTAGILHQLAAHQIIHKDIKPGNILINPETLAIELIDFSIATQLSKETQTNKATSTLEGTLAYISPEQTGRMNRGIDYRTDFYALGATLYELLTGVLPFASTDPLELLHCHLAQSPLPPHQINEEIPTLVSDIVLKLMAKNAEDRYQSALGLQHDLQKCLSQWEKEESITGFELGDRDHCEHFLIPEKLYGRTQAVHRLLSSFERVSGLQVFDLQVSDPKKITHPSKKRKSQQNSSEIMLISGPSGMGKTALVNEIYKPITRQKSHFVTGKFDQFNQNLPLSAFIQAFKGLTEQLLSQSAHELSIWQQKITEAVGDYGQILIDVIPDLAKIIGPQPLTPPLSGTAAQNRFNLLFQKFIAVFTNAQQPLAIFLDDLQWVDTASLKLIHQLMEISDPIFLICAYRDNEVSPVHPFMISVESLQKAGVVLNSITLNPLSAEDTNRLIADTLHCPARQAKPLTELVRQKTEGNPFFTTQFLKSLYADEYIRFNPKTETWDYDLVQVATCASSESVIDFMTQQLQKLPDTTQNMLQLAACIGNQFDLATLAIAAETTQSQTAQTLWEAIQEGLIIPQGDIYKLYVENDLADEQAANSTLNGSSNVFSEDDSAENNQSQQQVTYRFLHDRVQQAAYACIDGPLKQSVHLKIGERLLAHSHSTLQQETLQQENLFAIVNHLNIGRELIKEPMQKLQLAQLNLQAGQKAKATTAYAATKDYLFTGISLLEIDCWEHQYELTLTLHEAIAEAALLCGDFEQMEGWAEKILKQAKSLPDKINIYDLKIQAYNSRQQFLDAINTASEILQLLGLSLPTQPTQNDVIQAMQQVNERLANITVAELADLPPMSNQTQLAVVRLINTVLPAAFLGLPILYPILVLQQLERSLEYGNAPQSALSYACYGLLLNNLLNQSQTAKRFGQLALELVENSDCKSLYAQVHFVVAAFITHRTTPLSQARKDLLKGYKVALESGNLEYVGYYAFHISYKGYLLGQELGSLERSIQAYTQVLSKFQQIGTLGYCQMCQQTVLNLIGKSPTPDHSNAEHSDTEHLDLAKPPYLLVGDAFDELVVISQLKAVNDYTGLFLLYLHKLTLSYLFESVESAQENAANCRQYLMGGSGFSVLPLFYYYDSLTALQQLSLQANKDNSQDKHQDQDKHQENDRSVHTERLFKRVEENHAHLVTWAEHAPMNYLHRQLLIEAERDRVLGNTAEAIEKYEMAIATAQSNGFSHEVALANELTAKFYLGWGKLRVAAGYLQEAYYGYAKWGAKAKVLQLERNYPQLLVAAIAQPHISTIPRATREQIDSRITHQQISQQSTDTRSTISTASPTGTSTVRSTYTTSTHSGSTWFDFSAITKAAQAISQEIELKGLLTTLMKIVLNSTGAQVGYFILNRHLDELENGLGEAAEEALGKDVEEDLEKDLEKDLEEVLGDALGEASGASSLENWSVVAKAETDHIVFEEGELITYSDLPHELIKQVIETQIAAVFDNLSTAPPFAQTPYVQRQKTRSALCTPIVHKGKIIGLLYLENNLVEGAFPSDRIEMLQVLTSQAAISIENAKLYKETTQYSQTLEAEVAQKTQTLNQKVQDLEQTLKQLKEAQAQLIQTEKMSSLGQLVSGVAHEINNPVNFIHTNIKHLERYNQDLLSLVEAYQQSSPDVPEAVVDLLEDIDLDFVEEDSRALVQSIKNGSDRIKTIVLSLRNFARLDEAELKRVNIHEGIESTLVILQHRLNAQHKRPLISVVRDYGDIPKVTCYPGQLNQVLLHLLNNAIDALETYPDEKKTIHIRTDYIAQNFDTQNFDRTDAISISIADNGIGIPEEVRSRIFDPFFSLKSVGEGSGLGLSISHQIITEKHHGKLYFHSQVGQGTEWVIEIPTVLIS